MSPAFERPSRPRGVTALAVIYLLVAMVMAFVTVLWLKHPDEAASLGAFAATGVSGPVLLTGGLAMALALSFAFGFLGGWRWAWRLAIVTFSLSLVLSVGMVVTAWTSPRSTDPRNAAILSSHLARATFAFLVLVYLRTKKVRSYFLPATWIPSRDEELPERPSQATEFAEPDWGQETDLEEGVATQEVERRAEDGGPRYAFWIRFGEDLVAGESLPARLARLERLLQSWYWKRDWRSERIGFQLRASAALFDELLEALRCSRRGEHKLAKILRSLDLQVVLVDPATSERRSVVLASGEIETPTEGDSGIAGISESETAL